MSQSQAEQQSAEQQLKMLQTQYPGRIEQEGESQILEGLVALGKRTEKLRQIALSASDNPAFNLTTNSTPKEV